MKPFTLLYRNVCPLLSLVKPVQGGLSDVIYPVIGWVQVELAEVLVQSVGNVVHGVWGVEELVGLVVRQPDAAAQTVRYEATVLLAAINEWL
ncbi:hypothetical protein [Streptomyces sp. NPDC001816]|uniref:hypothetical protein n=1 Tax=Streptomyces sp. NPDC001816 TaxID=3364612 RepID=UPI0036BE3B07